MIKVEQVKSLKELIKHLFLSLQQQKFQVYFNSIVQSMKHDK